MSSDMVLISVRPLRSRATISPLLLIRMLAGMALTLYNLAPSDCQPFKSLICGQGMSKDSIPFTQASCLLSNDTPTISNPLACDLL